MITNVSNHDCCNIARVVIGNSVDNIANFECLADLITHETTARWREAWDSLEIRDTWQVLVFVCYANIIMDSRSA